MALHGSSSSSSSGVASGTSFPVSPASGDRYYRSDRNIDYVYDGTRWLSTEVLILHFPFPSTYPMSASVSCIASFPTPGTYDIYVEEFGVGADITSATPASNNFSTQLQSQTGSGAAVNVGSAAATSGFTVNTWANSAVAINSVIAKTVNTLVAAITRVGTGTGYVAPYMRYRLVG